MPSPFNSNYNGMTVPDYFWAELWTTGPLKATAQFKERIKVEPFWDELNGNTEYLSYFKFNYNIIPSAGNEDYFVKVFDGGYLEESLGTGFLGQTWTWNNWGGVNATDALAVQKMVVNTIPVAFHWMPASPYGSYYNNLADVNASSTITSLDALIVNRRAVGFLQKYTNNKPNFAVAGKLVDVADFNNDNTFAGSVSSDVTTQPDIVFTKDNVANYVFSTDAQDHEYSSADLVVPTSGNKYLNIYYTAVGDINASYVPQYGGFKTSNPTLELQLENELAVSKGDIVKIPVRIQNGADLGAISINLNYRKDLIEVLSTNYAEDFARIDAEQGTINIGWYDVDGANFNANDELAIITVRVINNIEAGTPLFELNSNSELADPSATVINGNGLKTLAVNTTGNSGSLTANNYPNPFNNSTTINYNLPESGKVTIEVFDGLGKVIKSIVEGNLSAGVQTYILDRAAMAPGVYQYRITLQSASREYSIVKRMVVVN
jgi:hypothetical protein